jgi:LCP family protein required for cell wall assembly
MKMRPAPADPSAAPDVPPRRARRTRRFLPLLLLIGVGVWAAPAVPVLARYAAWPATPERTRTFLVAGVTPIYVGHATRAPENYGGLTDTILLVQLRAGERVVRTLSVPRDTWTNIPGWGMSKINAANVRGGPDALVRAVGDLTGIRPEGYVLLSLQALRDVTDAAGGVTMDVEQAMKYDDNAGGLHIDVPAGRQHLSGSEAEAFLRFRHDALGDLGRVARQQKFLGALADKLTGPAGLVYGPRVVGALGRNVRTNLAREDVSNVLGALLRRPEVDAHTLPGDFGGGGTWVVNRAEVAKLAQGVFAREAVPGDPRDLRVTVVNVNAPTGSARRLADRLAALGYRRVSVRNGDGDESRTVLIASDRVAAAHLARDVGYGRVVLGGVGEPDADLTVRLGADTPESQD